MTTTPAEKTSLRVLAVLRRGDLDERDAAIVRAVARAWGDGRRAPSYRELAAVAGFAVGSGTIHYHIHELAKQGWLKVPPLLQFQQGIGRAVVPGKRFGGLDTDRWPLEKVKT